jgi:hypothetical protein
MGSIACSLPGSSARRRYTVVSEMVFDLVCRQCGRRSQRHWLQGEAVSVTECPMCRAGMSVIGIAFFAEAEQTAA